MQFWEEIDSSPYAITVLLYMPGFKDKGYASVLKLDYGVFHVYITCRCLS